MCDVTMQELNERQRADLAATQLHHCQTLTAKLQERNKELENKIVEVCMYTSCVCLCVCVCLSVCISVCVCVCVCVIS